MTAFTFPQGARGRVGLTSSLAALVACIAELSERLRRPPAAGEIVRERGHAKSWVCKQLGALEMRGWLRPRRPHTSDPIMLTADLPEPSYALTAAGRRALGAAA